MKRTRVSAKKDETVRPVQLKPREVSWPADVLNGLIRTKSLQLMLLPGLVYYVIFRYLPMYGIIIAFKDFNARLGIVRSPWVGFEQFIRFFAHPYFFRLVRNTFLLSFYDLLFGFPAPIILAIMLNELRNQTYKRFVQTISYLPHFISIVSIVGILTLLLSPTSGSVNTIISRVLGLEPIYFMAEARWFRFLYVSSGIWQNIGWGAIIYLAALSQVDVQLYDAATVDGSTRLQRIWHISLPSIMPTIVILLILRIGSLFYVGFEKVILMYNPVTYQTADVIGSYVYRRGLQFAEFSYGAAVGLFNSVVNIILLLSANWMARRVTEQSLW